MDQYNTTNELSISLRQQSLQISGGDYQEDGSNVLMRQYIINRL